MDLAKYHKFKKSHGVCQNALEWQHLLEYFETYFKNRGIKHPIVVELGVERNNQKKYFEEFLNAEHIGIDMSDEHGTPDILGDVFDLETKCKLDLMLYGRDVNLLMIELDLQGNSYQRAYEEYGKYVKNIISLHSIETHNGSANRLWRTLLATRDEYLKIAFFNQHQKGHEHHLVCMGCGLVVKDWK